jgi:hypothetical protein
MLADWPAVRCDSAARQEYARARYSVDRYRKEIVGHMARR